MHSNVAFAEFQSFKETSATDDDMSIPIVGNDGQKEQPLQQCIMNLPHAGSVSSIVSRLPFATVAVCRRDTVGIVRLASLLDGVIPDATTLRFSQAGFWKRVLLIKVP